MINGNEIGMTYDLSQSISGFSERGRAKNWQ